MSEVLFPVRDLLRRKLQTTIIIVGLTLCVASTVFLLLLSGRLGWGISLAAKGKLTIGFSAVFSQLLAFVGVLVFAVGVATVSFMVFFMMSQRTKDIGLMKAIGCPNSLIFGYFMNELLMIAIASCVIGVALGIAADVASAALLANLGLEGGWNMANLWLTLPVIAAFLIIELIFGAKPILDATKVEAAKVMSPTYYVGLSSESAFKAVSRSGLMIKLATRNLFRRTKVTIRMFLCLAAMFLLLTVAVAGGVIASRTMIDWIRGATGRNVLIVGHHEMLDQYRFLYSRFYEAEEDRQFNYTNARCLMPENLSEYLSSLSGVADAEARLVMKARVREIRSYIIDPETQATIPVGDSRERDSLIVGVEPDKVLSKWFIDGRFLSGNEAFEAVVGDSLAQTTFSRPLNQSMSFTNETYDIVGVCLEPVNNGFIAYVPLNTLYAETGVSAPNVLMIRLDGSVDRSTVVEEIKAVLAGSGQALEVYELDELLEKSTAFVRYLWSVVMAPPFFSLLSASISMTAYVMLAVTEQRQEHSVLRALGAKPSSILGMVSLQTLIVLLSSYGVGVAFGLMTVLMILVPEPVITELMIAEICGWLLAALIAILVISLYPAAKAIRAPIVKGLS